MDGPMTRRRFMTQSAAAVTAASALAAREDGNAMTAPEGAPIPIGIVGCGEGTHGKVWAEMLAAPGGERFGMRPTRVWDADRAAAEAVAQATGASVVRRPEDVAEGAGGVLITELHPARYLELARPFLEAGRRVFLNRPFAGSVRDAKTILGLSGAHGASVYSASALYHTAAGDAARAKLPGLGAVRLFNMTGASEHLGFYLPHAVAALTSVLGIGVARVQALSLSPRREEPELAAAPVVVYLEYADGSPVGPARGVVEMIGPASRWYGFVLKVFGAEGEGDETHFEVSYDRLLQAMAGFFRTGREPVPGTVLLEQTAIYYAALRSARERGRSVTVSEMLRD